MAARTRQANESPAIAKFVVPPTASTSATATEAWWGVAATDRKVLAASVNNWPASSLCWAWARIAIDGGLGHEGGIHRVGELGGGGLADHDQHSAAIEQHPIVEMAAAHLPWRAPAGQLQLFEEWCERGEHSFVAVGDLAGDASGPR